MPRRSFALCKKHEEFIGGHAFRQAGAFVIHKREKGIAFFHDAQGHRGSPGSVTHGIFEKIAEDAIHTRCIADGCPIARGVEGGIEPEVNAFLAEGGGKTFDRVPGALGQIHRVRRFFSAGHLSRQFAGKGFEDSADHLLLPLRFALP